MKFFLLACSIVLFDIGYAQEPGTKYFFSKIGWTIVIPKGFTLLDSTQNESMNAKGTKAIEESNNIKADISETQTLIAAKKNQFNYFNATLTPFDQKRDGNFKEVNQTVKDLVYKTFSDQMPNAVIDSATTIITINRLVFDRFRVTITIDGKTLFNSFLLTKLYKGYQFGISYIYLDEETKKEIEIMIGNSKFKK